MDAALRIVITEVTNMHNGHVCVGGWCVEQSRMVRPLSGPREHWDATLAGPALFEVGNVVTIVPSTLTSGRGLPHSREDCVLTGRPALSGRIDPVDLAATLAGSESPSVEAIFAGHMKESRFVSAGADCPSLGAIQTNARRLGFEDKSRRNGTAQLRCWLYDETDTRYNLPVASRILQAAHADGGLQALADSSKGARRAHVRIGLAHPFDDGRSFAMVNHVFFF